MESVGILSNVEKNNRVMNLVAGPLHLLSSETILNPFTIIKTELHEDHQNAI